MKRCELMHFIDVNQSHFKEDVEPKWCLLGEGIEELTVEMNAKTESRAYINYETEITELQSYGPSFSVTRKDCLDDETRKLFKRFVYELPTGQDAKLDALMVDATEVVGENEYLAYKRLYTVTAGSTGGAAAQDVEDRLDFGSAGDQVKGTFNPTTKVFTPAA